MKKTLTLCMVCLSTYLFSQNLVTNAGFEDDLSTFTVAENGANVLKRVINISDANNDVTFPTSATAAVNVGQWVKKSLTAGDDLAKAIVVSNDAKSGNSALNLQVGVLASVGYDKYTNMLFSQKLSSSLDNTQKYVVSFWAKPDATANNTCKSITVMLTDNTLKQVTYPLASTVHFSSSEWTKYTVVLDIPKYKVFYPTVDFASAFLSFGISTTYTADSPAFTNYSGVLVDEISMVPYTGPEVKYVKIGGAGDGSSWENASSDINKMLNEITRGEVRVAAGTYFINSSVVFKDSVTILGGYGAQGDGIRRLVSNQTILDGSANKRIILGSELAAPLYYGSKFDGFILQRGNSDYGSAARMTLGCVLENCIIRNNTGNGTVGAAVFFSRNLKIPAASSNKNYQNSGALINCIIINNTSSGGAGAIYDSESTLCSIINCVVAKNECTEASVGTGGLYIGRSSQWIHVQNSIFYRNSGATTAFNNIKNSSTANLFAILNNWFDNSTMPVVFTTDTRSICKDNKTSTDIASPDFVLPTSFIGATTEQTLINELNASNWTLAATSKLIGLGNSTQGIRYPYENMNQNNVISSTRMLTEVPTDVIGNPRLTGSIIDMGAYQKYTVSGINPNEITENFAVATNNGFKISGSGMVRIFDLQGTLKLQKEISNSEIEFMPKGIFILSMVTEFGVKTIKILK